MFTVNGDYVGGGSILVDADLVAGTADSAVINGAVSGVTSVDVNDVSDGVSNPEQEQIAVIDVSGGSTAAGDFVLASALSVGAFRFRVEFSG